VVTQSGFDLKDYRGFPGFRSLDWREARLFVSGTVQARAACAVRISG
jgi:hypothetical protein